MGAFQQVQRHGGAFVLIILLQLGTVFILLSRDSHQSPSSTAAPMVSAHTRKARTNEVTLTELDHKYHTSKGRVHRYTRFYEHYLSKYRHTNFRLLEIGLGCGMSWGVGVSAALWREYFGPAADIHFVEYDQECGEKWMKGRGQHLNITMHYGSQEDRVFLQSFAQKYTNGFDAVIDDGGHRMIQQINSLTILFPSVVRSGGTYAIEDVYTSYLPNYDGRYLKSSTLIEFIKQLVDDIQSKSPTHKNSTVGPLLQSFELSDKICLFTKK